MSGKPYIGELTFISGYGFYTDEYYEMLGKNRFEAGIEKWKAYSVRIMISSDIEQVKH